MTPLEAAQQHTATSLTGLYDAASDTTLTFTSFSPALGTPFDDSSLLSPPGLDSTLGSSIGLMGNKNGAYIQLLQQYELIQNELRTEKMEHNRLK